MLTQRHFEVCRDLSREMDPLSLQVQAVASGPDYFQSVYFTFGESQALHVVHHRCVKAFEIERPFFPHLSLVYGRFEQETRRVLCQRVTIPSQTLTFDRLQVWAPDPVKGWEDVALWRKLA